MAFLKKKKDPFTQIQTCLQKRDYKGALVWFKPLLDKDSKNTQVRLRFADTLVLAGSKREAIKQYRVVADELAESGFMIRAIAINKKIVQLDPTQSDVHEKLAAMNEERSRATNTKSSLPLQMSTPVAPQEEVSEDPPAEAFGMEEVEDMDMESVGDVAIGIEEAGVEEAPAREEVAPSDHEEPSDPGVTEPTLSLDESMAMEFGGALREQPSADTPPFEEGPAPDEEVMELGGDGDELTPEPEVTEPRGFELEAEEESEFQLSVPSFEESSESSEIEPSAVEFDLDDEDGVPAVEEPEEALSFDEEPVALIESQDVPAPPEEELVLTLDGESEGVEEPEGELLLESEDELEPEDESELLLEPEGDLELEPEVEEEEGEEVGEELDWDTDAEAEPESEFQLISEGDEMELDIETEPEMAADGKDALVGLLGDDIDSMIDSIIDDVGSSISGAPSSPPKAATRIPLFSDLTAEEFVDVAIMLVRRSEKAGTVIVTEGAPGDSMFIVSTGEVEATKEQNGEAIKLATLCDGDFFGEMAVLSGEPRSATVTANKNTELLELSRSDLNVICSRHPEVEAKLRLAYDERSMRNG